MPARYTLLELLEEWQSHGATPADIAARLGELPGTVRVALHRACRGGYALQHQGRYYLTDRGAARLDWQRARSDEGSDPIVSSHAFRCGCHIWVGPLHEGDVCESCGESIEVVLPRQSEAY